MNLSYENTGQDTIESKEGILLVNLGTPAAPERSAVARYLREFLSDKRVVDLPRWLWLPLLNFVIIPVRSGRSAKAYAKVWTEKGSPLLVFSEQLASKMQDLAGAESRVVLGMRYGEPSIKNALKSLRDSGVQTLKVLPLYPQFSYTTTASVYDGVNAALAELNWRPDQVRIDDYHVNTGWIRAVADTIREHWSQNGRAEKLLFSMHGIPQRYVDAGDPYKDQCEAGISALVQELGLSEDQWLLTFQSRLGREPWLQPYTDKTLEALGEEGVKSVQVVCPGFAVDCLETLEEIAMENAEIFEEAGGERFEYIPCLNDSAEHARALLALL